MTPETFAEKVARLQREIGMRQLELQHLVCGNPSEGVSAQHDPFQIGPCDHRHYTFEKHGRRCTCGALMIDFGD